MSYLDQKRVFKSLEDNKMSHYIDLSGMVFGYVTVINKAPILSGSKHSYWVCRCCCGVELTVSAKDLKRTKYKSCGCKNPNFNKGSDITGRRFGKLTVLKKTNTRNKENQLLWECVCDCGNIKLVWVGSLTQGFVKSCGCLVKNNHFGDKKLKRLFKIWHGMMDRCYKKDRDGYRFWGGKGVIVCELWKKSFQEFAKWSLSNGYKDDLTIDRFPDNNGNYEPLNCRWATFEQQANNKSNNTLLYHNGETKTISEWSKTTGLTQAAISQRIRRLKWSIEDALSKPSKIFKNGTKRIPKK